VAPAFDLIEVEANQLLCAFLVLDGLFESMIELRRGERRGIGKKIVHRYYLLEIKRFKWETLTNR